MEKKIKLKVLPEVGKEYHIWDDGKTSPSRHYICRVERLLTPKEAMKEILEVPRYDHNSNNEWTEQIYLYEHWKEECKHCDWLFSEDTDAFVEASCPNYDDHNLWFVRTKDGGWFSLNIQNGFQGASLDVDEEIYNNVLNFWENDGEYDRVEQYKKERYAKYK